MTVTEQILHSINAFGWKHGLKPTGLLVSRNVYNLLAASDIRWVVGLLAVLDDNLDDWSIQLFRPQPAATRPRGLDYLSQYSEMPQYTQTNGQIPQIYGVYGGGGTLTITGTEVVPVQPAAEEDSL